MLQKNTFKIFVGFIAFSISYFVLLNFGPSFFSFDYYAPRTTFWDLSNGFAFWECYKQVGLNVFKTSESTLPILEACGSFSYGYASLAYFGAMRFLSNDVALSGIAQIIVFVFLVVFVYLQQLFKSKFFLSIFALFSPGIFLLFASGNLDIFIIILLITSSLLMVNNKEIPALILISFSALCKFYTAPVMLLSLLLVQQKKSKITALILLIASSVIISYQFVFTPPSNFGDGAQNKFGASIFDNYARKMGLEVTNFQGNVIGISLLLIVIFVITCLYYQNAVEVTNLHREFSFHRRLHSIIFLIMASTSIFCYISVLNVDYRLVFIALAGISLMQITPIYVRYISEFFPIFWLLSIWIVYPFQGFTEYTYLDLQPLGDIMMIITMAFFVFQGFFVFNSLIKNKKVNGS